MEGIEMLRMITKIKWLSDQPVVIETRVIVAILSDKTPASAKRIPRPPSLRIVGKVKILGDIISPAASEVD
jgi:hypothetical protein